MYRYAEIDGCGFIIWIRTFSEPVEAENMIPIDWDFNPDNVKCWNGTEWEEYKPEPTQSDRIEADTEYVKMMLGGAE